MFGLDVIEVMTPLGHPSIINKIFQISSFPQVTILSEAHCEHWFTV